ncbi:hypothetical protein [Streptomyces sp. CB03238]|uniref:hypothetical protein n=1 Tax=Streptomyces sp. CB03238 TaxID=1907777 RepID=UPI000A11C4B0|nr:hypothetical protein [Streptomyces sp. CB03238]ORT58609.1 hypothetical protein BKD26_18690 [Streptomyces sp. CB03238]
MAELDLNAERITALSREQPPHVTEQGAAQSGTLEAGRTGLELLSVVPGSGQAAGVTGAGEANGAST